MKETYLVKNETTLLPFLKECCPSSGLNALKTILHYKHVNVNGVMTTKGNLILKARDKVEIDFSKEQVYKAPFNIIFEDEHILIIDKKPGLLTIATSKEKDRTAYHQVGEYLRLKDVKNKVFIVHRLDRETSGLLIFAKSQKIQKLFQESWDTLLTKRGYKAIIVGQEKEKEQTLSHYLVESTTNQVYVTDNQKAGSLAVTSYKTIKESKNYSLLDIEIKTGRKNQIRVQLAETGHPIVGDKKYGNKKIDPLERLCLVADELKFTHPITREQLSFKLGIPFVFNRLFKEDNQK